MLKKNTPQLWNNVWNDLGISKADSLILDTENKTILWQQMKKIINSEFKSFENLDVLEIGSGTGTYAALMAKYGAKVTLLDYSSEALDRAKVFFKNNNLQATFIQGDAFDLPKEIKNKKFDVSISIGLTEHFKGKQRVKIHKVHLDVLKKGGLTFISVPNKFNLPYRVYKSVSELTGTWKFGEEYPFSRSELINICEKINGQFVEIFGDNLYKSIKFLLPANFLRRFFKVGTPRNKDEIREENGTIFDQYLSYSLVLVMKKK